MVCMSPRATLNLLDGLGTDHDEPVCEWRDGLLVRTHDTADSQVSVVAITPCWNELQLPF